MKKILFICTKYPLEPNNSWLTREMAEELSRRGNSVDVLCIDWSAKSKSIKTVLNNVNVYNIPALMAKKSGVLSFAIKWFLSSVVASIKNPTVMFKRYDLTIGFSPCSSTWFPIFISSLLSKKKLLIYWDFFPIHQSQINLINGKFKEKVLKFFERRLVHSFDYVGCMSALNCNFFKEYFGEKRGKHVFELPIWSEDLPQDVPLNNFKKCAEILKSNDSIYFIFGGQIEYGRGVECILDAARIAHAKNPHIVTIIIGNGRLAEAVKNVANSKDNGVIYSDLIPRTDYLNLLSFCRGGIIATVPNVSVPTYPSKSLDYMKLSLPIIASIEDTTDFGDIITEENAGISCQAGDAEALADAMILLANDFALAQNMGRNANVLFHKKHVLTKVVDGFMKYIDEDNNV